MRTVLKSVAKSFKAALERIPSRLGWVIIRIPFDVHKIWGVRGQLRVKGEINGFAFRTTLFPTGAGRHYLLVNKRMQAGAHARTGTIARFHLEPDTQKRVVTIPPELQCILDEERSFRRWFDQLNHSIRKWIADWITGVKSAEARARRAEQTAEQLLATMEAERELPPILQLAFARDPRAREGWQHMSPSQRRGHLLAIFHYRSPDARDRRIAKMLEDALAFAERKRSK
jgi:uncharacterized protein YdeI (YjbR/CyaY-like superfamily)